MDKALNLILWKLHFLWISREIHGRSLPGEPFRGDEVRRAQLRAELDAYYARLYGLTRDELRYTPCGVDPKEIYGEDFPGETVRVVREKEIKQFGEYWTSRLVLEAWDGQGKG